MLIVYQDKSFRSKSKAYFCGQYQAAGPFSNNLKVANKFATNAIPMTGHCCTGNLIELLHPVIINDIKNEINKNIIIFQKAIKILPVVHIVGLKDTVA